MKKIYVFLVMVLIANSVTANTGKITRTITDYDEYVDENIYGYIPAEHADYFIKDWYKTDAKPNLTANIEGNTEFEEKEVRELYISIKNKGHLKAMQLTDKFPRTDPELWAAKAELELESEGTTAYSIIGKLEKVRQDEPFDIESNIAYGGMLRSDNVLNPPLSFKIKIHDDAKPGVYPLKLNISYVFMQDVATIAKSSGDNDTTYDFYYDMHPAYKTQTLKITIKPHPEFKVVKGGKSIRAGTTDVIESVIKNTGNVIAKDCVAYISVVSPFNSKIDEYYLGDMKPGEERTAKFKIETDADALPQIYGITTRVEYKDIDGRVKYSDTLKTPVMVTKAADFSEKLGMYKLIIYVIGGFIILIIATKIKKEVFK